MEEVSGLTYDTDDNRAWLAELLPKSAHKHIPAILDHFDPPEIAEVEIVGGRVRVEEVEAYGLVIDVDANGNATAVRFPYGAVTSE